MQIKKKGLHEHFIKAKILWIYVLNLKIPRIRYQKVTKNTNDP